MARISKNSKLCVNDKETRYAIFPSSVVINKEEINVWGYNKEGEFWFQREHGEPIDEPYLNYWWYRDLCINQSNDANHHAPAHFYKWVYRCITDYLKVPQRTVWYKGDFRSFKTYVQSSSYGYVYIPLLQFFGEKDDEPNSHIRTKLSKVMFENGSIEGDYGTKLENGKYMLWAPRSVQEIDEWEGIIENSIAEVDALVEELGFSQNAKPQTPKDKIRVARVIYNWLTINNPPQITHDWKQRTIYPALSNGIYPPSCSSYTQAAHLLLSRYGIENVCCSNFVHGWNIVNYHDTIGNYTDGDSQWCVFDCMMGHFNLTADDLKSIYGAAYDSAYEYIGNFPTTNPMDEYPKTVV